MADTELTTLLGALNSKRKHVLGILEGLDEEALRRPVLPSGWTCLGLVNHLALDDEKFWFRAVAAGERTAIEEILGAGEDAWKPAPELTAEEIFARYRKEAELADAFLADADLDVAPAWWPDFFGDWRCDNLREVILHVITETATHAGHLDAVRELIDGKQRLVVD
ncbi:DinB family protein [Kitasatospora viridis]|uniref:Putative damage-inducible protein DinB n=1 Tax=Kitasatospora viridis TaxID=281105 RepID=A0A561T6Y9_9ACTN|nr:DinB family protein [Kitasatospora viridis]TWF82881.1 putative damage-inducible protein DinB [Kitasatospora viridis]